MLRINIAQKTIPVAQLIKLYTATLVISCRTSIKRFPKANLAICCCKEAEHLEPALARGFNRGEASPDVSWGSRFYSSKINFVQPNHWSNYSWLLIMLWKSVLSDKYNLKSNFRRNHVHLLNLSHSNSKHLISVLKQDIPSGPLLHKTSPCSSSLLGLCCLRDKWRKARAIQCLTACSCKIWETRESHCPASILPTTAWPGSAFAALYCPGRPPPLNRKKKLVTNCLISSCTPKVRVSYISWGCSSAGILPSVSNQQCSQRRNSTQSRREPRHGEQVEIPKRTWV